MNRLKVKHFLKVIVFKPTDEESKKILRTKTAKIYGDAVKRLIEGLNCPKQQKLELIDEIIKCKKNEL